MLVCGANVLLLPDSIFFSFCVADSGHRPLLHEYNFFFFQEKKKKSAEELVEIQDLIKATLERVEEVRSWSVQSVPGIHTCSPFMQQKNRIKLTFFKQIVLNSKYVLWKWFLGIILICCEMHESGCEGFCLTQPGSDGRIMNAVLVLKWLGVNLQIMAPCLISMLWLKTAVAQSKETVFTFRCRWHQELDI